jgi:hypothetical protein
LRWIKNGKVDFWEPIVESDKAGKNMDKAGYFCSISDLNEDEIDNSGQNGVVNIGPGNFISQKLSSDAKN